MSMQPGDRWDPAILTTPERMAEVTAILVDTGALDPAIIDELLVDDGTDGTDGTVARPREASPTDAA